MQATCTGMRLLWNDGLTPSIWGAAADRALRTKRMLYPGVQSTITGAEITLCMLSVHGWRSLRWVIYECRLASSSTHVA